MTTRRLIYSDKTIDDFNPPDLLAPTIPETTTLGNQSTQQTYQTLIEARKQIETPEGEARFRKALQEFPDVAQAMFSVLFESRKIIAGTTTTTSGSDAAAGAGSSSSSSHLIIEPPPMPLNSVQLPVNCKSWLQPKKGSNNSNTISTSEMKTTEDAAVSTTSSSTTNNLPQQQQVPLSKPGLVCYFCGGKGHISRYCPKR